MFKKAEKQVLKLKLAIDGPSGSGKTFSALKIASGLVGEGGKICVIDTENSSASLYADFFDFDIGELAPPYTPEKFIEILRSAESLGYDCIIIDSISHEWKGSGGILDIHGQATGNNSFASWGKVTPRHENFLQAIIGSPVHIIATMRSKQGYVLEERNKKQVPVKVGMEPVQRDGIEYEFTCVFSLNLNHEVSCAKDRTQLFSASEMFIPDETTGIKLAEWLSKGKKGKRVTVSVRIKQLHACADLEELQAVFQNILKTRRSYSKTEMGTLIAAKDAAKVILSNTASDDNENFDDEQESSAEDVPKPDDAPPTKPSASKKKPKKEAPPAELHPSVLRLKELYEDKAYGEIFNEMIYCEEADGHEIRAAVDGNKHETAAEIVAIAEKRIEAAEKA